MAGSAAKLTVKPEDRYSRLGLITWWKQEKIASARVLVVGAGALGNEILKNLALLGFRQIVVVDLDQIEVSNLSRTILFSESDIGTSKAVAAAAATKRISPGAEVVPLAANVISQVGLGVFDWADVVLAGLDSREARLWLNRACWRMNRPFMDGAIEGINGVARVFLPGRPPCYECTLGETDWRILQHRLACNLLTRAEVESGKVPTTPTSASIIAAIQVQEAVKLIHSVKTLEGEAFVFEGLNHSSYRVAYTENADCMSHHTHSDVVRIREASSDITMHDLWIRACAELGRSVVIEPSREVIHMLTCPACGKQEEIFAPIGALSYADGRCSCSGEMRIVRPLQSYTGTENFGRRRLDQLGLPLFDVFVARNEERERAYLMSGDGPAVMGTLARIEEHAK